MKKIYVLLITLFFQSMNSQSETTIYLIRHAEKADITANTALSAEGNKRAIYWANHFKETPIDLFYSTPYLRTESTCLPLSNSKQKQIITYTPKEMNLKRLIAENPGKTIFIVGHSNTIPTHINQLLGEEKYPEIPESEFGNLYIIKEKNGVISHSVKKI